MQTIAKAARVTVVGRKRSEVFQNPETFEEFLNCFIRTIADSRKVGGDVICEIVSLGGDCIALERKEDGTVCLYAGKWLHEPKEFLQLPKEKAVLLFEK